MVQGLYEELVIAGYGGQGIILIGKLLAHAAMHADMHVTYMPAYGAEVRGGAASCMVVIADGPVASPAVTEPNTLITMNKASCDKFYPRVLPNGVIILNSSHIESLPPRQDVTYIEVPAEDLALQAGHAQCANMVMLGAYLQHKGILDIGAITPQLPQVLSKRYHHTIATNEKALQLGWDYVAAAVK